MQKFQLAAKMILKPTSLIYELRIAIKRFVRRTMCDPAVAPVLPKGWGRAVSLLLQFRAKGFQGIIW